MEAGGDVSERQIVVRMDLSSWRQIRDDLGNYWGMDPDEAEVFESVEILGFDEEPFTGYRSSSP